MAICVLTLVWTMVTLITDWNSVFYRKAYIYKKRVDAELARKRDRLKQSITEGSSSQLDGVSSRHKSQVHPTEHGRLTEGYQSNKLMWT